MRKFTFSPDRKVSASAATSTSVRDPGLYTRDRYAWSIDQMNALQERRFSDLDIASLVEEIADVGRRQHTRLEGMLITLLMHLLKWDHLSEGRSPSWEAAIDEQRHGAAETLERNPSLKDHIDQMLQEAYEIARERVSGETDLPLDRLPEANPYDWQQAIGREIKFDADRQLGQVQER